MTLWTVTVAARVVGDVFMFALDAPRDMPTKRCCAAALDCRHHFQLVQAYMTRVCSTPSTAMGAEDIRDLQYWTRHGGLCRSAFALLALGPVQVIQWAVYCCDHTGGHAGIARCCRQLSMPEQRLYDPDIDATFQQMGRKTVPQRMQGDWLGDPGFPGGLFEQPRDLSRGQMFTPITPFSAMQASPVRQWGRGPARALEHPYPDRWVALSTTHATGPKYPLEA